MSKPAAYSPEYGYKYQILCRNQSYGRAFEHCDYAKDKSEKIHLLENYRMAYGGGWEFKTILLPRKYWPLPICDHCGATVEVVHKVKYVDENGIGSMEVCNKCD